MGKQTLDGPHCFP